MNKNALENEETKILNTLMFSLTHRNQRENMESIVSTMNHVYNVAYFKSNKQTKKQLLQNLYYRVFRINENMLHPIITLNSQFFFFLYQIMATH